ncbi:sialidase-2-like [Amphiura filiformis]|uniref:sialidase-2-like n=1 Tax=Amphiura filiformis TaxID=82378 RepID=UPI003B20DA7A
MNSIKFIPILIVVISTTLLISIAIWTSFISSVVEETNENSADESVVYNLNIIQNATTSVKGEGIQLTTTSHDLFHENSEGFAVYRLPAIVYHQQTFLVFCEGRKGTADSSISQIVMKRGHLNGTKISWDQTLTVVAKINGTRLANPVPFVDKDTNTIFVAYNVLTAGITEPMFLAQDHYNQSILLIKSQDLGVTWSEPHNITDETLGRMHPVPIFYAPGPGHAIQMKSGRLVMQGNYYYREINSTHKTYKSNTTDHGVVFVSDNHGQNWRPGGFVPYAEDNKGHAIDTSESSVVELANNTLCINSRTLSKSQPRAQALSTDGGDSFGSPVLVKELTEPENIGDVASGCEGSTLGFTAPKNWTKYGQVKSSASDKEQPWVLFSNPADPFIRIFMSIRLSTDGCQTWSKPWTIWDLASGYSDLVQYDDANNKDYQGPRFGIVYENGYIDTVSTVSFMTFTLDDVRNGVKATKLRAELKQNQIVS